MAVVEGMCGAKFKNSIAYKKREKEKPTHKHENERMLEDANEFRENEIESEHDLNQQLTELNKMGNRHNDSLQYSS
jgi:hypothetical protein